MTLRLIDLSQEIFQGMSVFPMHQPTFIMTNMTHEDNQRQTGSPTLGFSARNLLISEHGGTHSDAVWEYKPSGKTIDQMDLSYFWGSAICVDLRHVGPERSIEVEDLKKALQSADLHIEPGDIFLMYTGHYDRNFGTALWQTTYTGLSRSAAQWLAEAGVVNIGVDAPAIDHPDDLDFSGHHVCGQYDITNTENLANLGAVAGRRFLYMGLPLKIRAGSGSPIRAVALLED